ncbi:MAG: sulfite exporter TauE/SafE family protein [Candidatus Marinamargulisbacteria bacterium]
MGVVLTFLMGTVLGLLGGGGSILTVPILVYFFDVPAVTATSYSLFVVGITSALIAYRLAGQIAFRIAVIFAIPATVGVLAARVVLLTMIPSQFVLFGQMMTKDQLIMGVFAILILVISVFMFRAKEDSDSIKKQKVTLPRAILIGVEGVVVGALTGFVGAGGGFMIVPALVLLVGIELRPAIATSLLIIAIKSLLGFVSDVQLLTAIDWPLLLSFTGVAICGGLVGMVVQTKVPTRQLRQLFAYFVFVMGITIWVMN